MYKIYIVNILTGEMFIIKLVLYEMKYKTSVFLLYF